MNDLDLLREYFPEGTAEFAAAKARLDSGEPLAYVTGEAYFYDERYKITPACLIPRPDTECLVEAIIKIAADGDRIADLCCGSGCVGISSLRHTKGTTALAVDISPEAVAISRENARINGVAERYEARVADILSPDFTLGERFAIVASNPPYIRRDVIPTLDETVRAFEPHLALDGGDDGLDFYRVLLARFDDLVLRGGAMLLEIGFDQGDALRNLASAASFSCKINRDYGGRDRVAIIRRDA